VFILAILSILFHSLMKRLRAFFFVVYLGAKNAPVGQLVPAAFAMPDMSTLV
jgi:hypothetical protein